MKTRYYPIVIVTLAFLLARPGFAQFEKHTPYPIIFVHGLIGDSTSWTDRWEENNPYNDVIDYLEGTGLTNGGVIHVCLDFNRNDQRAKRGCNRDCMSSGILKSRSCRRL